LRVILLVYTILPLPFCLKVLAAPVCDWSWHLVCYKLKGKKKGKNPNSRLATKL
jgi:hypothetical protein